MAAARAAFPSFASTTKQQRLDLLRAILAEYVKRYDDVAEATSREMGAPLAFARCRPGGDRAPRIWSR